MAIKLKLKGGTVQGFLNKDILYVDVKMVNLDRVLINLFRYIYYNGAPSKPRYPKEYTLDSLKDVNLKKLEENGLVKGATNNPEAVENWLRSSLLEIVNRGNIVKEHVSALKPLHLQSYLIRNSKYCRDYRTSDQLYLMLKSNSDVLSQLTKYLSKGWDDKNSTVIKAEDLDVDTAGILYLTQNIKDKREMNTEANIIPKPFLTRQSALFTDDIRRLLVYKDKLPRTVFIDYLRILCGFHLTLYTLKVIYLLPEMVEAGSRNVEDDWSMVVDLTDNLDSRVSPYACKDYQRIENRVGQYIRSTYMADIIQNRKGCDIDQALYILKNDNNISDGYYEQEINRIMGNLPANKDDEFDQNDLKEMLSYFPENDYFAQYVQILEKSSLGAYQYKYLREFLDSVAMKNSPSMLLADSRSRRHPRRGVLGSRLLETLVQLLVLKEKPDGGFESRPLSLDELTMLIRNRYSLIINGMNEERFAGSDIETAAAFKENTEALKNKLRQIGFYKDMSDACILQKIRPRYKF